MDIHFGQNIIDGTWAPSFDLEHHSRCWHIHPIPGAVETESMISIDSVEIEITCNIVPPPAWITTKCGDIATVRIIVTIVCCEVHSILNVAWNIHDVTQVTGIPSNMDSVILWFALHTKCVVFSWIPRTVHQHEFDPQFVWSAVRHLMNLFQSQPEVSIGTSDPTLNSSHGRLNGVLLLLITRCCSTIQLWTDGAMNRATRGMVMLTVWLWATKSEIQLLHRISTMYEMSSGNEHCIISYKLITSIHPRNGCTTAEFNVISYFPIISNLCPPGVNFSTGSFQKQLTNELEKLCRIKIHSIISQLVTLNFLKTPCQCQQNLEKK